MNVLTDLLRNPQFFVVIFFWSLIWKGIALWRAANNKHVTWFILLLTLNTLGILEILYITYLNKWELGSKKVLRYLDTLKKKIR